MQMTRVTSRLPHKPAFELDPWYSSEAAKRRLGPICQAVNEQGATVGLLGTKIRPLLLLEDADSGAPSEDEVEVTIDEAKADWSSVTDAALFLGARFRVLGKRRARALLRKHPEHVHPAFKYRRLSPMELKTVAEQLERLRTEVHGLGDVVTLSASRIERAADITERRIREIWREAQKMKDAAPGLTQQGPAGS
jgi:hypothetical protein